MTNITIEEYSLLHQESVIELILEIQKNEFGIPISVEEQPDLNEIQNFYQANNGNFWIARIGSLVIGSVGLLDIGNGQGALRKMFVHKNYRGSVYGVAKQLLDCLIAWAVKKKFTEIYLGTTERFIAAHRFYEKNGFVEIDKANLPRTFPVMAVDVKFYNLIINE